MPFLLKNSFLTALIFFCSLELPATAINFKSSLNGKEIALRWNQSFEAGKFYLIKGSEQGYPLFKGEQSYKALLPGHHEFIVWEFYNSNHLHVVVLEKRKDLFSYHAWSVTEEGKGNVFEHDLNSLDQLDAQDSIQSSAESSFDFKQVMRVPYTDKYFSFSKRDSNYLKCLYLSKLRGANKSEKDCILYERMQKKITDLDYLAKNQNKCFLAAQAEGFSASSSMRMQSFVQCLRPSSEQERGCLKNYLKLGHSFETCLSKTSGDGNSFCNDCDQLKDFVATRAHYPNQKIILPGSSYTVELEDDFSDKLILLHCSAQFLATVSLKEQAQKMEESYSSCAFAYHEARESRSEWSKYLAKWFVEKKTHHHFENIVTASVARKRELSYWLGRLIKTQKATFPFFQGDYQDYAHHLIHHGFFEHASPKIDLRAPASVSP